MIVDIILVAIIALAIFIGWKRGLVMSVFLLGSTILAIILASLLSPVVSAGLEKVGLADAMSPKFTAYVESALTEDFEEQGAPDIDAAIEKLPLPDFLSEKISENIDGTAESTISSISGKIGAEAAKLVCALIAFAIIFVLVMILMQIAKVALKVVVKIPIVKQADKIGGIIVGFIQGGLFVLVVLLFISAMSSVEFMQSIVKAVEGSTLTKFLYEANFVGKIISALM